MDNVDLVAEVEQSLRVDVEVRREVGKISDVASELADQLARQNNTLVDESGHKASGLLDNRLSQRSNEDLANSSSNGSVNTNASLGNVVD